MAASLESFGLDQLSRDESLARCSGSTRFRLALLRLLSGTRGPCGGHRCLPYFSRSSHVASSELRLSRRRAEIVDFRVPGCLLVNSRPSATNTHPSTISWG